MNNRRVILAILTLLTLSFAGVALAQSEMAPNAQSINGLVVSSTPTELVVRTDEGQQTFMLNTETLRPATLQANLPVTIQYVTESGGKRAVRVVENTQASAASAAPGSQESGDQWPGAANKVDHDDQAMAETSGSAAMDSTATGTAGSTDQTGTAYRDTTGTTTATGSTGSMDHTMANDTMANDTTDTLPSDTSTMAANDAAGDDTLPATGSSLPLLGLAGLLALGAGAALHFGRHA